MKVYDWKIFNKKGSYVNWSPDAYINLVLSDPNGKDAKAFAVTDTSALIDHTVVTNSGYNYEPIDNTAVTIQYAFGSTFTLNPSDYTVNYIDVSVFDPDPRNTKGIGSITIDSSIVFTYPSYTYSNALFLDPISKGLVETEHLTIFQDTSSGLGTPYDPSNGTIKFRMEGLENEISLFTVDEDTQEIIWTDEVEYELTSFAKRIPVVLNIGFRSEDEGVFERRLRCWHVVGDQEYLLWEMLVNAQSIGEDERFSTIQQDFGLFQPKELPKLFKEADINEDLPNWELLNYKGKHLILEHDQIIPYIGTYKGLVNAIKWLGYEDIKIKEWFKNVKENRKLSLYVPYDAAERSKTVLAFSPQERKNLKKLNELSLVYCITRETGEVDEGGNPETEECYEYNLNEIFVKLYSLKQWLEKNIIGVNARIVSLDGEGIYLERFRNLLYATQNKGNVANYSQSLSPKPIDDSSELVMGDASIDLTLKEFDEIAFEDYGSLKLEEFADYMWDPSNGQYSLSDASSLSYVDPSAVTLGNPVSMALPNLYSLRWVLSNEKTYAGILSEAFVTNPLFVLENEIRFANIYDTSTIFYDSSTDLKVVLEKAYLRDPSNDIWEDSISYSIYAETDASGDTTGKWILESSMGVIESSTWGFFSFYPDSSGLLQYAYDDNYKVPLVSIQNFKWTDTTGSSQSLGNKFYFLDVLDGKISMNSQVNYPLDPSIVTEERHFINFNYDTSLLEQKITYNVVYDSNIMPLYAYDPSIYYNVYNDPSSIYTEDDALVIDNSTYTTFVNHIGNYYVEIFGYDGMNNIYTNLMKETYQVWTKYPTIIAYIDNSCNQYALPNCSSSYMSQSEVDNLISEEFRPIFDRQVPLQGLTLEYDTYGKPYLKIPSISYFIDVPDSGANIRLYNLTERCSSVDGTTIYYDPDYQTFYDGDDIKLVSFDKGMYSLIEEASSHVITATTTTLTVDNVPSGFSNIDPSTEMYVLNDTEREVYNITNDTVNKTVTCDISLYKFRDNQVVGMIIDDVCTGYSWGASFRVLDASDASIATGYTHTLSGNIPQFVLDNSTQYTLTAKHAFSTYVNYQIDVSSAKEVNNNFEIYLDDKYYHQYYLDSTFVFVDLLFDQEKVLGQWYDPSDNLVNSTFYGFNEAITVDISTLVILRTQYDPSNYMLEHQNIWTIREHQTGDLLMKVFNKNVPYVFDASGTYDIQVEAYDKYGNLKKQIFEGLITVQ